MPTRHKGIGMNRPKKRKHSPLVPGPIFEEDTSEPEEPCPAPAPAPSPPPAPTTLEEPQQGTCCASEIKVLSYVKKQAAKNFLKVRRRWVKTASTYVNNFDFVGKARSEVVRAHERLLQADKIHDEAWSKYILAHREWSLLKTFNIVSKRARRRPENLALQNVALLAESRLLRFRLRRFEPGSNVTSFWNPKDYAELVASECGLARTFGLMYQAECLGLQGHKPI